MQKIREKMSNWISNAKGTLKRLLRWDEIDAPVRFKLPNLEEIKLNDLKRLRLNDNEDEGRIPKKRK